MYQFLFKYLEMFSNGKFATKENGSIQYEQDVISFMEEMSNFPNTNEIIVQAKETDKVNSDSENFEILNELLRIVKEEKKATGSLLIKLEDGTITNLIRILKRRYDLVESAVDYLETLPYETETDTAECFKMGANFRMETGCSLKEAFIMYEMFEGAKYKRGILTEVTNKEELIGMPWFVGYCKKEKRTEGEN